MSALEKAEQRVDEALDRLGRVIERLAAQREGGAVASSVGDPGQAALRAECDSLRQQLAEAKGMNQRLSTALDEVGGRLDRAIDRVGELAGE